MIRVTLFVETACVFSKELAYYGYADAHGVTRAKINISESKPPRVGAQQQKSHSWKRVVFRINTYKAVMFLRHECAVQYIACALY